MGVTCGTGVALFVDFVAYILRMNIYRAGTLEGKEYKLFADEKFDRLIDPSFKLMLFSSFKTEDIAIGKAIFDFLHKLSQDYKFNNFVYYLRVSSSGEPHWNANFFQSHIDLNASKVIAYGPLGVEKELVKELKLAGIKDSQFHRI